MIAEFVEHLYALGVQFKIDGEDIIVLSSVDAMTAADRRFIRAHKPALREHLTSLGVEDLSCHCLPCQPCRSGRCKWCDGVPVAECPARRRREQKLRQPVYHDAGRHGFGDAMISAWIAEGSKLALRPLHFYAQGTKARLLRLFGQEVTPDRPDALIDYRHQYRAELRSAEKGSRVVIRANAMGIKGTPTRPRLTRLSQAITSWADAMIDRPTALLFPDAYHQTRVWSDDKWVALANALEMRTVFVSEHPRSFPDMECVSGLDWGYTIAMMQRASLMIGLDSGPAHVAGTLDLPYWCLVGPTIHGGGFDHVPSVKFISVSRASVSCVGCYWLQGRGYDPSCFSGCKAMLALQPDDVVKEIGC